MSDQWTDDQCASTTAAMELPEGFAILWRREGSDFGGILYYGRGSALAGTTGERADVLAVLVKTAKEFAGDCCADLGSLPPALERFTISANGRAITGWACGRTSHHPKDVLHRYCGACQRFHDEMAWP